MKAYIYGIKNLINNKLYIGSTKSPRTRKDHHFYQLKKGIHHSPHLQKSYSKYGKQNFAFYIIEECTSNNRKEREIYHISQNQCFDRNFGYNVYEPNSESFKCSEETKHKLRNSDNCTAIDVYEIKELKKIASYHSLQECAKDLNIFTATISQILKGKRKSHKGLTFTLKDQPCTYSVSKKQRDMSKFRK